MPTNREIFFSLLKEENKYLTRMIIKSLLNDANGFSDELSLYKNFDLECPKYDEFLAKVQRIRNGEPFQYVLGYANFIDHNFVVNSDVLIPRQETEELVINVKAYIERYLANKEFNLLDVCTGSGVIGLTLKRYAPLANVYMTDIDENCLKVAELNAKNHGLKVECLQGDCCEPILNKGLQIDVLVANPPYIGDESTIDEQVLKYEPHKALFANPPYAFYDRILEQATHFIKPNGLIAFEIGENMNDELADIVEKYFPNAIYKIAKDMYGKFRFLFIILREDIHNA